MVSLLSSLHFFEDGRFVRKDPELNLWVGVMMHLEDWCVTCVDHMPPILSDWVAKPAALLQLARPALSSSNMIMSSSSTSLPLSFLERDPCP